MAMAVLMAAGMLSGCRTKLPQAPVEKYTTPPTEPITETEAESELPTAEEILVEMETYSNDSDDIKRLIQTLTLEQKILQMFMVTPEALTGFDMVIAAGDATREVIWNYPVGGLIYFSDNLQDWEQTKEMLSNTQMYAREATGLGMFLAVDEEGGFVARVADSLGTTNLEDMGIYGAEADADKAYWVGQTIARDIGQFGFNVDFAPVADVNICEGNELGSRIFSDDPEIVSIMVENEVKGMQANGVAATLKHFPGLGAEDGNAHTDSNIYIDRSEEEMKAVDFVPFQRGIAAGAEFVMVSHQIVSGAGDNLPADLSPAVVDGWLRRDLGFRGIAVTDSQQMHTITDNYTSGEAAILSIEAGMDIILIPDDFYEAFNDVKNAVESGRISEQRINSSVLRILREKEKLGLIE